MNTPRRHRRLMLLESLEARRMFAVSLDSNGWYNFTPASDTQIIYVSSSTGDDTRDGLTPETAVKNLTFAKTLVRNGSADWLLLKRGDTFSSGFGTWTRSGRNSQEPLLIGAYGEGDRPQINSGTSEGILTSGGSPVNNLAINGLRFFADGYTGSNGGFQTAGLRFLRQGSNYLIQDVKVEGYKDNIVLQGDGTGLTNIEINRVISIDAYNKGSIGNGHAQGLYAYELTNGLTIERSVFDHNGYKEGIAVATGFNHDLYINTGAQNVVVRNNIISRGANNGLLLRAGGTVQDNLFVRNSVGAIVDHTASTITGNVVLESVSLPTLDQGVGFNIEGVPSALIANNIIAHDTNSGTFNISGIAINSEAGNVVVQNNIAYDWRNEINNGGNRKITIRDNQAQHPTGGTSSIMQNRYAINTTTYFYSNNIYSSPRSKPFRVNGVDKTFSEWIAATGETNAQFQKLTYVDPNRSVGSYYAPLGGDGTTDAFLAAARNQSLTWDDNLSAAKVIQYIRDGFEAAAPTGQILGTVYDDVFGNGVRDGTDSGVSGVTVYLDSDNDGQLENGEPIANSDGSGNYSFANLADGTYHVRIITPAGRLQTVPASAGSVDLIVQGGATYAGRDFGVTGPLLRATAVFDPQTAQTITISFNTDASASLDASDLQYLNRDTNTPVDSSGFTFDKTAVGSRTIANWKTTSLPADNYRVTLPKDSVSSVFGGLPADLTYDFYVLGGDGDRNRVVDIVDFNILAANFGKLGKTFLQGNYNYSADGKVDIDDFNVLAGNFGKHVNQLSGSRPGTEEPPVTLPPNENSPDPSSSDSSIDPAEEDAGLLEGVGLA